MRTDPKLISLCLLAILAFSATYVVFSDDSSADSVEQDYTRYYYDQLDSDLAKYLYNKICDLPDGCEVVDDSGRTAYRIIEDIDMSLFAEDSYTTSEGQSMYDEFRHAFNTAFEAFNKECYDVYWVKHVGDPSSRWEANYSYVGEDITAFHATYYVYKETSYPALE